MIVRLRLETGTPIRRQAGKNRHVAYAVAALLWPAVLMAYSLTLWALAAQVRLAGDFAIPGGIFSHWQVWAAAAVFLHLGAVRLNRYGRTGDLQSSLNFLPGVSREENREAPDNSRY